MRAASTSLVLAVAVCVAAGPVAAQDFLGRLARSAAQQAATRAVSAAVSRAATPQTPAPDQQPAPDQSAPPAAANPVDPAPSPTAPQPGSFAEERARWAPLKPGEQPSTNPNYRSEAERLAAERNRNVEYRCNGYSDPSMRCAW